MLKNYVSAMDDWHGRVDSETDYDSFRWHQWVRPLDLNKENAPFDGPMGFAIIGFCSEQGVRRNKGRVGTALAPDYIRGQMSNLPCTFDESVKLFDAGNILCQEISMEEGQAILGRAVEKIRALNLFPIVLGGGHETTFGHYQGLLASEEKQGSPTSASSISMRTLTCAPTTKAVPPAPCSARSRISVRSAGYTTDTCRWVFRNTATPSVSSRRPSRLGSITCWRRRSRTVPSPQCWKKSTPSCTATKKAYLTICTDVFSSAFAPGVSATQSIGLDPEKVLPVIKHIIRSSKVIGFDICEISPRFDQDNTTASLGAVIIFSVVNTICKLKGLGTNTEADFYG